VKFRWLPLPPRFTNPALSKSAINWRILRGIPVSKQYHFPHAVSRRDPPSLAVPRNLFNPGTNDLEKKASDLQDLAE
jgi:hypothetical protein